jgi:hypothetical protein
MMFHDIGMYLRFQVPCVYLCINGIEWNKDTIMYTDPVD